METTMPGKQDSKPVDPPIQLTAPSESIAPKMVRFEDLARCGNEIWIENNGQLYRLQRTKQGKLILTK